MVTKRDLSHLKCKYEGCEKPVRYPTLLLCGLHYQWARVGKTGPWIKIINCEVCNNEIVARAGNQRFCKECQYQRRLQQHYDRHRAEKVNKICKWCGCEFITNRSFQLFCCKDCFKQYDSEHKCDYYYNVVKIRDHHLGRRESYPQQYIYDALVENFSELKWEYDVRTILRSPVTKHMLELDIWCPDKNFAIEFDGEQHFKPKYGERVFKITRRNDKIKEELCVEKNIKLLRISYKDDLENKDWVIKRVGELINDNI